jgi:hypothetical protein
MSIANGKGRDVIRAIPGTLWGVPEDKPPQEQMPKQIKPLDPPMVPFVLVGMGIWALLALLLLPFRDQLAANGHGDWIRICVAGLLVALPGLVLMIIHDRNRKRRRANQN